MPEKGNFKQDDLIAKLVKDPKAPPDALLLSGFLGASSEDEHTRLYLTATLDDYVEIPNDAILHSQEVPKDQSPLGGSLLWIKKDAELIHGKVGPNRTKAKFLEGRIQQEFVRAQAAGVAGVPGIQAMTLPQQCFTIGPGCPTHALPCTHAGPFCPTAGPTILPCCQPSLASPCPSHPVIACPTNPIICTHLGPQCHPSLIVPGCTHFGPECPIHTIAPPCPIHTLAPPCPVGSGPFCGGQPGGPVEGPVAFAARAAAGGAGAGGIQSQFSPCQGLTLPICSVAGANCPTIDGGCTVVGLNCPSQIVACTLIGPGCGGGTLPPPITVPPACHPTFPAPCPTQVCTHVGPGCPTHQVACTIGGPACGITGPQCPVQSAFCPVTAPPQCIVLTHNQPICHPSVVVQCPTVHVVQCIPSVAHPCLTLNQPICHPSLLTPCITQHVCTAPPQCPIPTGPACQPQSLGCPIGGGPVAAGVAHAAALSFTAVNVCTPARTVGCEPTLIFDQCHHTQQCHPTQILCHTVFCPTRPLICFQVTQQGCQFPTQFCPSVLCPSAAFCGGFGGFGGLGQ